MDRDSEVETIQADDDWFDTTADNINERHTRRQNTGTGRNNFDIFDEEELFSPSGSLSSLHEFSGSDSDSFTSDDSIRRSSGGSSGQGGNRSSLAQNENGKDGLLASARLGVAKNRDGSRLDANANANVLSSAAHTESEVDVDGDDGRSIASLLVDRKPPLPLSLRGSSPTSQSKWQVHRGRKVIADDDDDDGAMGAGDDADTEDGSENQLRRRKKQGVEGSLRRHLSKSSENGSAQHGKVINHSDSADSSQRKHRSNKRRRAKYEEPDYVDSSGCPQLVYFASKGDAETCRKLLLRGASINLADSHGWTALHEAAKGGHHETLMLLLNPPTRARHHTEAEPASESSSAPDPSESRISRQLRSPLPNVNLCTMHSRLTPLHQAVMNEDFQATRLLLDNGASTSIANSRQLTPLDTCSNEKIARLLTDRAKTQRMISARDKAGQTKLHRACNAGDLEQTVSLINQGADINMKDNAGWTPLHEAALEGHNSVVVALLRRGAEHSAKGFGGDTPLHDACANGHFDVVRSLLTIGADPHLKNNKGVTPEDMARDEEQDDVLQLIEQHRRNPFNSLQQRPPKPASRPTSAKASSSHHAVSGSDKGKRPSVDSSHGSRRSNEAKNIHGHGHGVTIKQEPGSSEGGAITAAAAATAVESSATKKPRSGEGSIIRNGGGGSSERQSDSAQSRLSNSPEQGSSNAQKRELMALKRLREEAEAPQVNYYYSSSSSKLSRDERKLQVIMGTIARLEKRKPKDKQRRVSGELPEAALDDGIGASIDVRSSSDRDVAVGDVESTGSGHSRRDRPNEQSVVVNGSPKKPRSRSSKKRIVDDDDDDEDSDKDSDDMEGNENDEDVNDSHASRDRDGAGIGDIASSKSTNSNSNGGSSSSKQPLRPPLSKRSKHHATPKSHDSEKPFIGDQSSQVRMAAIDVAKNAKNSKQKGTLLPSAASANASGNTAKSVGSLAGGIKLEDADAESVAAVKQKRQQQQQTQQQQRIRGLDKAGSGERSKSAQRSHHSSGPSKDRSSKHHRSEGGRTIVEGATSKEITRTMEGVTPESIAAQAIRYLPLYTIQLHCDPPASKLDYFVVDLQIRLLLGMPIDTPSDLGTSENADSANPEFNPLFEAYPHLCRQRITEAQKEHLWEPLAGMFVSNMQFIHGATSTGSSVAAGSSSSSSSNTLQNRSGENPADSEIVNQFTLHEKKKFVALSLYFVKLDEIVELIRRDYSQISQQLITITLDLSSMGLAKIVPPLPNGLPSRPIIKPTLQSEVQRAPPTWNGPQKMVPLRYALKLHYRDTAAYAKNKSSFSKPGVSKNHLAEETAKRHL
ncbi:hypothetical protein GGI07_002123 [Coemansia sp. Benny D115]|nr:hypothetical protein GGI07_002123 [Coemansia sp. Benny D115]